MNSSMFTYGDGGTYGNFLSRQKNADGVSLLVDLDMAHSLSTQTRLAQNGLKVMGEISGGVMHLRADVQEMNQSIREMSSVIQHGFYKVSLELNGIKESLGELLKVAKTPDQTWAMEQYSIASKAYEHGHFLEALDYVNRAIEGHNDRSGFKLEHRFHFLRGLMRVGGTGNTDMALVDPKAAVVDFLNAAKYSSHHENEVQSRCFAMAGWASYCAGRMEDARLHLESALSLCQTNTAAEFDYAKVLYHTGNPELAGEHFYYVLIRDWKYGLRAASDGDFLKYKEEVHGVIERRRMGLVNDIKRAKADFIKLEYEKRMKIAFQFRVHMVQTPINYFNSLVKFENDPIDKLLKIECKAEVINLDAEYTINAAREKLVETAANAHKVAAIDRRNNYLWAFRAAVAMLILMWVIFWIDSGFLAALILGTVSGSMLGGVTFLLMAFIIMPVVASFEHENALRKAREKALRIKGALAEF